MFNAILVSNTPLSVTASLFTTNGGLLIWRIPPIDIRRGLMQQENMRAAFRAGAVAKENSSAYKMCMNEPIDKKDVMNAIDILYLY